MAERPDIREAALDTLLRMEKDHTLSHIAVGDTLRTLQFAPRQDRAFFTRLCEGVVERRIYLEYILNTWSKVPLKKCRPVIRCLLLLGAYQILFLHTPDAAACNEAVRLAKKRGFSRLTGFVNGVLRTVARQKDQRVIPRKEDDLPYYCSIVYSVPVWLVSFLMAQYGPEDTEKMLASFLQVRPVCVRTNLSRITVPQLWERLTGEGISVQAGTYLPYALKISGYDYLGGIQSFQEGLFGVQDESSMLAVQAAGLKEGDRVLDLCAAPGGKSFHAADLVGEGGRVFCRDLTDYKIDLIRDNNRRFLFKQMEIYPWDARVPEERLFDSMDVVLADLPCSGMGIIGRKNDIKYHITREQCRELVKLQRSILKIAWRYVKPGGRLVYSTCTLNQEENLQNAVWIRENTPLRPVSVEERLPEALKGQTGRQGYLQLLPGIHACDGFFIACFQRG